MKWKEYRQKYGLFDLTDPYDRARVVARYIKHWQEELKRVQNRLKETESELLELLACEDLQLTPT